MDDPNLKWISWIQNLERLSLLDYIILLGDLWQWGCNDNEFTIVSYVFMIRYIFILNYRLVNSKLKSWIWLYDFLDLRMKWKYMWSGQFASSSAMTLSWTVSSGLPPVLQHAVKLGNHYFGFLLFLWMHSRFPFHIISWLTSRFRMNMKIADSEYSFIKVARSGEFMICLNLLNYHIQWVVSS